MRRLPIEDPLSSGGRPFRRPRVLKALNADVEAMTFIATAPHVKVETVGGIKYTRLQQVQCPSCETRFYLWSPTLTLKASEVKAQAIG